MLAPALERLGKWRMAFASWQLGTRASTDPECQAVRDHREVTMMLRVEVSAIAQLLIQKGTFTTEQLMLQQIIEANHLNDAYEKKFPGFKAHDSGMTLTMPEAAETMKGWPP